jgi:hypothetical protein
MLSGALQRNAQHEARLSSISVSSLGYQCKQLSEIESLASRTPSAALQLRFAQNDILRLLVTIHLQFELRV